MENNKIITVLLYAVLLIFGCDISDEKKTVIYTTKNGEKTTDISKLEGKVSYQVIGEKQIPIKAQELHQQARTKGVAGDYEAAIKILNQAILIAPNWAYPYYDKAYTYLLMGEDSEALKMYRKVNEIEPGGFFTTKTAIWTLEREMKNEFNRGIYLSYISLEWLDFDKKMEVVDEMIQKVPSFAPAWKEKALLTEDDKERKAYIEKALNCDPDPETHGILLLNKAALLNYTGEKKEALDIVKGIIKSDKATNGTKTFAKEMLKTLDK